MPCWGYRGGVGFVEREGHIAAGQRSTAQLVSARGAALYTLLPSPCSPRLRACFVAIWLASTPARFIALVNRVPHSSKPRVPSSLVETPKPARPRVVLAAEPPALLQADGGTSVGWQQWAGSSSGRLQRCKPQVCRQLGAHL